MAFGTDASNRLGSPQAIGATFFNKTIDQSLRLDGSTSYLNFTPTANAATDSSKMTFSTWVKTWGFGISDGYILSAGASNIDGVGYTNLDNFTFVRNGTTAVTGNAVRRDPSSWYHLYVTYDADDGYVRIYVNGVLDNEAAQTTDLGKLGVQNQLQRLVRKSNASTYLDLYLAETHFVDGSIVPIGTFGETKNGVWVPVQTSGITYGNNGWYLDYADTSDIGKDVSGQGNHWTANNLAASDVVTDSPTNNYSTLNPLQTSSNVSLAEGNLKATTTNTASVQISYSNMKIPTSGKWYFECYAVLPRADDLEFGISEIPSPDDISANHLTTNLFNASADACGILNNTAGNLTLRAQTGGGVMASSITGSTGDIYQIAFDCDTGKVFLGRNNTYYRVAAADGDPSAGTNPTKTLTANKEYIVGLICYGGNGAGGGVINFGQDPSFGGYLTGGSVGTAVGGGGVWKYAPPTGYRALNTTNLPEPVFSPRNESIENSFFYTTLYEGNGGGQRIGQFLPLNEVKTVNNAIRIESGNSEYLVRNYTSASNRRTYTISAWIKRGNLGGQIIMGQRVDGNNQWTFQFSSGDNLDFYNQTGGSITVRMITDRAFKDTSKWYHVVLSVDVTTGTSVNAIYVDGEEQSLSTDTSTDADTFVNATGNHYIGQWQAGGSYNGYMADFHFVDGQALDPTSFGQTDPSTETWIPKTFTGNHGQNGFHLEFLNNEVGADSANTNSFTPVNLTTANTVIDTPTRSFSTLDSNLNDVGTLSDGNLKIATTTNSKSVYSNFTIPTRGKWYWEMDVENYTSGGGVYVGLAPEDSVDKTTFGTGDGEIVFSTYNGTGYLGTATQIAATWCNTPGNNLMVADGEIIQFAYNADDGEMFIGKEGTWFRAGGARDTFANATKIFQSSFLPEPFKIILTRGGSYNETYRFNFGQETADFSGQTMSFSANADGYFAYEPPAGYKALNVDNFPNQTRGIARRKTPVFTWIKNRDSTDSHMLFDQVRGAIKVLHTDPDTAVAETTEPNTLQKFLPGGFQIGNDVQVNTVGESYVAWNWCMHDDIVNAGTVVNTDGNNINSTVLADKRLGFSIVKYTGTGLGADTVGHGLSQKPDMIINANINMDHSLDYWFVNHKDLTAADYNIFLNLTSAETDVNTNYAEGGIGLGNSSVFDFIAGYSGSNNVANCNKSGSSYISYVFHSVPGFSKFGSYIGNNNADGPFAFCGFKPGFLFLKNTANGATNWLIYDNKRDTYNQMQFPLFPSVNNAEYTSNLLHVDFLSNGFKIRNGTYGETNGSGQRHIFWAMAESPFKYANAR